VPGDRADGGEVDLRTPIRGVGAVAQLLERLRRPHPRQPPGGLQVRGGLPLGQLLGEVGELADAGDRVGAVRQPLGAGVPRGGDPVAHQARAERGGQPAGPLDLGEPGSRRPRPGRR
jgi:hypothetical protein